MSKNIRPLDEMITERYGARGTSKREKYERGYRKFKTDYLRELKTYKGEFTRLPDVPRRRISSSRAIVLCRLSLLIRRGKTS